MSFSTELKRVLKEQDLKQSEFAKLYGTSRQNLHRNLKRWETSPPTLKTLAKISKLLKIDQHFFLTRL